MECPFCGDSDFDLVGLKGHLLNSCEVFEQTETPLQEALRRQKEKPFGPEWVARAVEQNQRGFGRKS